MLIEDCVFYGNRRGLHLEATTGPVLVRRCEIVSNRQEPSVNESRWAFGSGLVLTHAANVTVEDCVLADNDVAQFGIRDDRATRTLADPATGRQRAPLPWPRIGNAGHRRLANAALEGGGRVALAERRNVSGGR